MKLGVANMNHNSGRQHGNEEDRNTAMGLSIV